MIFTVKLYTQNIIHVAYKYLYITYPLKHTQEKQNKELVT